MALASSLRRDPVGERTRSLDFVKMEGLGNDFVVATDAGVELGNAESLARRLCHRNLGVGADGLVLVRRDGAGAAVRIYNADGSHVRNCGNALRCVARLLWSELGGELPELNLRIDGGVEALATPRWVDGELWPVVRLDPPEFAAEAIPMVLPASMHEPVVDQELRLGAESLRVTCLSVGNPHCVLFCDELDGQRLLRLGPRLETAGCFPDRTNVELCQVQSRVHLEVLVWERGAGPTLACGTGACAAAVAARLLGKTEPTVTVGLPGGRLEVTWLGEGLPLFLAGPARVVFTGSIPLAG